MRGILSFYQSKEYRIISYFLSNYSQPWILICIWGKYVWLQGSGRVPWCVWRALLLLASYYCFWHAEAQWHVAHHWSVWTTNLQLVDTCMSVTFRMWLFRASPTNFRIHEPMEIVELEKWPFYVGWARTLVFLKFVVSGCIERGGWMSTSFPTSPEDCEESWVLMNLSHIVYRI